MPKKIDWTEAQDHKIKSMRAESRNWDDIAAAVGVGRWAVIVRGRQVGAKLPPPEISITNINEDPNRPCLPPGHKETWDPLVKGTCLEGLPYPIPSLKH